MQIVSLCSIVLIASGLHISKSLVNIIFWATSSSSCERSISISHQWTSTRGTAEIVLSLSSHHSPSFGAGFSSLGSARIVFLTRQRSRQKSIWCPECDRDCAENPQVTMNRTSFSEPARMSTLSKPLF